MSDEMKPTCPQCHGPLVEIRYPADSYLNRDQWESQIAGNWLCEKCPDNGRANNKKCYWWTREVFPAPPIAPAPQWSTTPPREFDAWFFWRIPCDPSALFIVHIVEDCVTHEPLYINGGCDSPMTIGDFIESVGWHEENDLEWWPVRIEPPR
jgi:hypothetical protein